MPADELGTLAAEPHRGEARSAAQRGIDYAQLKARAVIAGDLFREGRITRAECFRLEMDAALGHDTGPINYERNTEYVEFANEGVLI